MSTITSPRGRPQELAGFRGELIGPDDAAYEEARPVYNAHDRPAARR